MSDLINTTLFSTGCILNAFSAHNPLEQGVIIFLTDDFGESHFALRNNPAIKKLTDRFSAVFFDSRGTGESSYPLHSKMT